MSSCFIFAVIIWIICWNEDENFWYALRMINEYYRPIEHVCLFCIEWCMMILSKKYVHTMLISMN